LNCYDSTAVNSLSAQTCVARACMDQWSCNCEGTSLCSRSAEVSRLILRPIANTDTCEAKKVTETIVLEIPGGVVPTTPKSGPELQVFNQSHCACAPKASVVGSMTCYDLAQPMATPTMCNSRPCVIHSYEYVCDMLDGNSLCERELTNSTIYQPTGPETNSLTPCSALHTSVERPQCVSSCM
jgi:hypothetical protein